MKNIGNFFSKLIGGEGGFLKGAADIVDRFVQTKEEKAAAALALTQLSHKLEMEANAQGFEIEKEFNDRLLKMEGTASDLSRFGFVGSIIIFLRGAFRPVASYLILYVDVMVFLGDIKLPEAEETKKLFYALSLIIFIFYFGERTIKNVIPILGMYFGKSVNK